MLKGHGTPVVELTVSIWPLALVAVADALGYTAVLER